MGLDIRAYERAELASDPHTDEEREVLVRAFVYEGFEPSLDGLEAGRWYRVGGKEQDFSAGSYSGYGEWRAALCRAAIRVSPEVVWASPDEYRDRPFFLLINFADNEGIIGPKAAERLAREFEEHAGTVRQALGAHDTSGWFTCKYDQWHLAFRLAAGGGLVSFH